MHNAKCLRPTSKWEDQDSNANGLSNGLLSLCFNIFLSLCFNDFFLPKISYSFCEIFYCSSHIILLCVTHLGRILTGHKWLP